MESLLPIGLVLLLVLAAEFVNGWTDAPNAIATVVSTRVLSPYQALGLASVLNVLGAMSGTAVAATIGKGIAKPEAIGLPTVAAAMVAIVFWSSPWPGTTGCRPARATPSSRGSPAWPSPRRGSSCCCRWGRCPSL